MHAFFRVLLLPPPAAGGVVVVAAAAVVGCSGYRGDCGRDECEAGLMDPARI